MYSIPSWLKCLECFFFSWLDHDRYTLYIYSVFSYSVSNVNGHICPNNFPEPISSSDWYFKIKSKKSWPSFNFPIYNIPWLSEVPLLSGISQMSLSINTKKIAPAHPVSCTFVFSWWRRGPLFFLLLPIVYGHLCLKI